MIRVFPLLVVFFLMGCGTAPNPASSDTWQEISSRDIAGPRTPLYRVRVPEGWQRNDPRKDESLADTMKPLTEYVIDDAIKITIHNFPSEKQEDRIPPFAQVARWKRQFDNLEATDNSTTLQSFSGYEGILFEGTGIMNGTSRAVMGWILQIGSDHYRVLSRKEFHPQMRADVTIKAVGPASLIHKHRESIIAFARSFELIEEIPSE